MEAYERVTGLSEEMRAVCRTLVWTGTLGTLLFAAVGALKLVAPNAVRSGTEPWPLEVWAGTLALAYAAVGVIEARRNRASRDALTALGCTLVVGLVWLAAVRQYSEPKWDFDCYYQAGAYVRHGADIYDVDALGGYRYLYSPLLATVLSAAEMLPAESRYTVTFLLWSAANYWAVMVFLLLLIITLRLYGVTSRYLWPAAAAAIICNVPLQRTLLYSQPNLHVANLIFGFIILYRTRPALAGSLLATAALLKTSPVILLLPVVVERRWRVFVAFVVAGGVVVTLSVALIGLGSNGASSPSTSPLDHTRWVVNAGMKPWKDFARAVPTIGSHGIYRDNSIQSFVTSAGRFLHVPAGSVLPQFVSALLTLVAVVTLLAMAVSLRHRALFFSTSGSRLAEGALPYALAAMVLASPLVWEHHWVFLQLPFCLLLTRARRTDLATQGLFAYALVFLIPTFDVFPLSYHRLAGLLWWAVLAHRLAVRPVGVEHDRSADNEGTSL